MNHLEEKFVSRKEIFDGKVLHVVCDTIELPNGKEATREICLHNGAVAVIPVLPDGRVIMERQYRYAHGAVMLEIPAGKLDSADEIPLEAAARELREETGALAGKMTYLGELVASPALVSEVIHLYLAEDLTFGERELDEDEFLDVEYIPLSELKEMVMRGEIPDGKTQIAVLKASEILKNR
ncbi:MAG: NUDIX hydrolase [Ruminococcaceae bacterium]|nr:NUDIX hydrolase [Oscillospiraceae bacterium]